MDTLLHDERMRLVLRQVPRFLSASVPLADKLDELCAVAVETLGADGAAVLVLEEGAIELTQTGDVPPAVLDRLRDPAVAATLLSRRGVTREDDDEAHGLVVPLRSESEAFGALYADRSGADFSREDEAVLTLVAEVLGPVVHHGVMLRSTQRAERWTRAAVAVAERFLAADIDDPAAEVVEQVWGLGEADAVGIMVPRGDKVVVAAVRGLGFEGLAQQSAEFPPMFSQAIMERREGLILDDLQEHSTWLQHNEPGHDIGPLMAVPLQGAQGPLGVLYLARRPGSPPYTPEHMRVAATFAVNAAVSMEWHAARRTQDELRMLHERNRIARDLHDNVVQRLFATGLYLQQASRTLDGEPKTRVEDAMTAIDQTIRQIRNTILVLRSTAADRLDNLLASIVAETSPLLGFSPTISMSSDVSRVTGPLAADLALCVREALSNVVQHAQATAVELEVAVEDGSVVLRISDNGVGIQGDRRPGGGLENLDERARAHGGTFTYCSDPGEGTTLRWRMPLSKP